MSIEIEVRGLSEAQRSVDIDVLGALAPVLTRSILRMADLLRRYPSAPGAGEWKAKATPKQRRAFFALLRRGAISGKRTGRLGRGWLVSSSMTPGEFAAKLTNSVPYATFVQGDFQANIHRGRWTTIAAVVDGEIPNLEREAQAALNAATGGS